MNKLKVFTINVKRKFKQMTCEHKTSTYLYQRSGVHFAFCEDCEKHLHFKRK